MGVRNHVQLFTLNMLRNSTGAGTVMFKQSLGLAEENGKQGTRTI